MVNFYGQEKLKKYIDSFTRETFPRTFLLIGARGCGKTLLAKYIAEKFGLNQVDITDSINDEILDNLTYNTGLNQVLIDLDKQDTRKQNILLKSIEEPGEGCYMTLMSSNSSNVLDTIKNRCQSMSFEKYKKDDLVPFCTHLTDIGKALEVCNTPGQLIQLNNDILLKADDLCNKIIFNIKDANLANVFKITNSINFSDEYSKIDLNLFLDMLKLKLRDCMFNKSISDTLANDFYNEIENLLQTLSNNPRMTKKNAFDIFLINIWNASRSE